MLYHVIEKRELIKILYHTIVSKSELNKMRSLPYNSISDKIK